MSWLGLAGSALGVVAGALQAAVGSRIPEWTGAKASPIALGLLTIGLSVLAGWAALRQRSSRLSVWGRATCALALIGPALLCLSTAGRLWYPAALLLVTAGILSIDSWEDTVRAFAADWFRVLLAALGGCQLLMAAGAAAALGVVGAAGGIALIAAACWRSAPRPVAVLLVAIGTLPFAVLAWTAIAPALVGLAAALIAIPVVRGTGRTAASSQAAR